LEKVGRGLRELRQPILNLIFSESTCSGSVSKISNHFFFMGFGLNNPSSMTSFCRFSTISGAAFKHSPDCTCATRTYDFYTLKFAKLVVFRSQKLHFDAKSVTKFVFFPTSLSGTSIIVHCLSQFIGVTTEKPVYPKARIPKSPYTEKPIYRKARIPKSRP
jgi:hypothetical protein